MHDNLRREIILENYQDPCNRGLKNESDYYKINTRSESCIDNLDFEMKFDNDKILDIRFDGEACAISTSAASILIKELLSKSVDEALDILNNYKNMINEVEYDEEKLGELVVYDEIYKQPNRKNCALLPGLAIDSLINELNSKKNE